MKKAVSELQAELLALQGSDETEEREELLRKIEEAKVLKSIKKVMDLTGDAGLDALCLITEDVNRILEDEEVADMLLTTPAKNETTIVHGMRKVAKLVPLIARKYRAEFANILAALTGKPASEILSYRVGLLIMMATKVLTQDTDMLNLFKR